MKNDLVYNEGAIVSVTKEFTFDSCHRLKDYVGACARLHGHTYKLQVSVEGNLSHNGMVVDFKDLKAIVKSVAVDKYDHSNLNEFFPNPTAEIMVKQIAVDIMSKLPQGVYLMSCKLWETSTSYAEWNVSLDVLRDIITETSQSGSQPVLAPCT